VKDKANFSKEICLSVLMWKLNMIGKAHLIFNLAPSIWEYTWVVCRKDVKMDLGAPELLIILVIVIVLFGPGRLGKVLGELGSGLKAFKNSLSSPSDEVKKEEPVSQE
jgi:sec-independent protein translocase protein TatA